jgi:hypothetical protein
MDRDTKTACLFVWLNRPCSQWRNVATLTPIIIANSVCETSSFARTARTSAGSNAVVLDGFIVPRRMRPARRTLFGPPCGGCS